MPNRMVPGNKTENRQKLFKMAAKSKMAAKIYIVIDFDIIALTGNVIPHFRLISVHWLRWNNYFYVLRSSRG